MTELILIRHGETIWNQENRWQGHLDSPLTSAGLQQAQAVAARLARVPLAALYSSDLGRACQAAAFITAAAGHAVITVPGLRERALGIFEGLTISEIKDRHPAEYERFASRDPEHVIPQGESLRAKHERAVRAIEQIVADHPDQRVAVVTHGGVLDSMFRFALGLSLSHTRRWVLFNGSLNTFFHQDGGWSLGTWGDTAHLGRTGSLDDY